MPAKKQRRNINFRQSAKSFKGSKQASVWEHINANLPYRLVRGILRGKINKFSINKHG